MKQKERTRYLQSTDMVNLTYKKVKDAQLMANSLEGFEGSEGLDGSEGSVGPDGQLVSDGSEWFERFK